METIPCLSPASDDKATVSNLARKEKEPQRELAARQLRNLRGKWIRMKPMESGAWE
jgi:hypothetical protein